MAVSVLELRRELEELIRALDRRVPRAEQLGEAAIARDAAALRAKAVDRLAELVDEAAVRPATTSGDPRAAAGTNAQNAIPNEPV